MVSKTTNQPLNAMAICAEFWDIAKQHNGDEGHAKRSRPTTPSVYSSFF
jgi:hypothetical protein